LKYEIELAISNDGITGTTTFGVSKGKSIDANPAIKDILSWTQDNVKEDFLTAYEKWQPRQK
jgi:hypothetical protein